MSITIKKGTTDLLAVRVSAGVGIVGGEKQYYLVYRGELSDAKDVIKKIYEEINKLEEELPVTI